MSRYRSLLPLQKEIIEMYQLAVHSIRRDRFETAYQKPHLQKNRTNPSRTPPELQNRCWPRGSIVSMFFQPRQARFSNQLVWSDDLAMTSSRLPSLLQTIH